MPQISFPTVDTAESPSRTKLPFSIAANSRAAAASRTRWPGSGSSSRRDAAQAEAGHASRSRARGSSAAARPLFRSGLHAPRHPSPQASSAAQLNGRQRRPYQNRSGTPLRSHSATGRSVAMGSSTIRSTCTVPSCARAPASHRKGTAGTWRRLVVGRNFGVHATPARTCAWRKDARSEEALYQPVVCVPPRR